MLIRRKTMMSTVMHDINVIQTHTNLVSSRIVRYQPYTASVVCDTDCEVYLITIKMGTTDITSTAWDAANNVISIESVTDTVSIECYAMYSMPSDYVRVDGIKNPSNAYVNTGYKTSYKNVIKVDFTKAAGYVISSKASGSTSVIGTVIRVYANGTINYDQNASGMRSAGNGSDTGRNTWIFNHYSGGVYLNGTKILTYNKGSYTDANNMWLYQCPVTAGQTSSAGMITHFFSIYDYSTTSYVRYYIPCLNDSGVAGFWDAARGVFQGSSNSTAFKPIVDGMEFEFITFEDSAVKQICVNNWGGHYKAGEISTVEAARVTNLGSAFKSNTTITKFNELRYFTGLTTLYISGSINSSVGAFWSCTNLSEVTIPAAPIANLSGAFYNTNVETLDFSPITFVTTAYNVQRMQKVAASCPRLKTFIFPPNWRMNTSYLCIYICLHQNPLLETVNTNGCDFSLMTYADRAQCFDSCPSLKRIIGGMPGLKNTITVSSPALTHDACVELFNSLGTVTAARTIKISTETYNTLTAEERAIATGKGWTIGIA